MRAPPFVVARKNAISIPGYYAAKKKMSSGSSANCDSEQNSGSGRGKMLEQSQSVTVGSQDRIKGDICKVVIYNYFILALIPCQI